MRVVSAYALNGRVCSESIVVLKKIKMGKQPLSHRYNFLPLLRSHPGGVQKELIVEDLPTANVAKEFILRKGAQEIFLLLLVLYG